MKILLSLLLLLAPTAAMAQEQKKPQSMRDAADSFPDLPHHSGGTT